MLKSLGWPLAFEEISSLSLEHIEQIKLMQDISVMKFQLL